MQVYSDPIDWEKIYRYTVDRGFYFSHAARCVEKSEFSVFEQHRLHGYKFRNLGVSPINQVLAGGRGANGGNDDAGSEGNAELSKEERFQRIARAASRKTDGKLNRTGIKTKSNEKDTKGKRKSTGSKQSAKKPVSKISNRRGGENPNSLSGDGITEETTAERKGRLTKHQNRNKAKEENVGSEAKRAKSRSRRNVTDPDLSTEHVRHLRAARQKSEDSETTEETDAVVNDKKGKKQFTWTRVPGGRNSLKSKFECKKGSKRQGCKARDNDEDATTAEAYFDEIDVDVTTDAIDTAEERHYRLWNSHLDFHSTPAPEGLGKLADYIHRIFMWVKKFESQKRG